MREFDVYFSFYDEQWGNFDDVSYKVMAETPFEAREKAWELCDYDEETEGYPLAKVLLTIPSRSCDPGRP